MTTQTQLLAPFPAPQILAPEGDLLLARERLTVELRRHPATPEGRAAAWIAAGWTAANDAIRDELSAALLARVPSAVEIEHDEQVVAHLAVVDAVRDAGRRALGLPDSDAAEIDAAILSALADEGTPARAALLGAVWDALDAEGVYPESQDVTTYIRELLG